MKTSYIIMFLYQLEESFKYLIIAEYFFINFNWLFCPEVCLTVCC